MSVNNAGLPNQPDRVQSATPPIGSPQLFQAANDLTTLADGSQWLRTGVLAPASAYPAAAKLDHLKAHAFGTITPGYSSSATQRRIATDGAGRYMVTDGDTTNVRMSSDYGQTWSNVAHNLTVGAAAVDVIYAAGTWLVVGNVGTSVVGSVSTNGTSFGAGFTIGSPANASGSTAQVAHSGSLFYVAIQSIDANNGIWSSPTGLSGSWTNRSGAAWNVSSGLGLGAGGGRAVAISGGSLNAFVAVDGSAGTAQGLPGAALSSVRPAYIGGLFILEQSALSYYTSSTALVGTWTVRQRPVGCATVNGPWAVANGQLIQTSDANGLGMVFTSDAINWSYQAASFAAATPTLTGAIAADTNTMIFALSGTTSGQRAASSFLASNYVGRSVTVDVQNASGGPVYAGRPTLYYRVK